MNLLKIFHINILILSIRTETMNIPIIKKKMIIQ